MPDEKGVDHAYGQTLPLEQTKDGGHCLLGVPELICIAIYGPIQLTMKLRLKCVSGFIPLRPSQQLYEAMNKGSNWT